MSGKRSREDDPSVENDVPGTAAVSTEVVGVPQENVPSPPALLTPLSMTECSQSTVSGGGLEEQGSSSSVHDVDDDSASAAGRTITRRRLGKGCCTRATATAISTSTTAVIQSRELPQLPFAPSLRDYLAHGGTERYQPRPEWCSTAAAAGAADPSHDQIVHHNIDDTHRLRETESASALPAVAEHPQGIVGNATTAAVAATLEGENAHPPPSHQEPALLCTVGRSFEPRRTPTVFGKDGDSALHAAIRENATAAALALIQHMTRTTSTATSTAAATNTQPPHYLDIPNAKNVTPLILAAQKGNIAVVRELLRKGADRTAVSNNGTTAVLQAAHFGHATILHLLLRAGGTATATTTTTTSDDNDDDEGNHHRDFHSATSHPPLSSSSNNIVEQANDNHTTPLMRASQEGHVEAVQLLVQAGASVNRRNMVQMTSLMLASQRGHANVCQTLLQHSADVDAKTNQDSTALLLACKRGHLAVVRVLVTAGCELYGTDSRGRTARQVVRRRIHTSATAAAMLAGNGGGDADNGRTTATTTTTGDNNNNTALLNLLDPAVQVDLMQRAARRKRSFDMIRVWNLLQQDRADVVTTDNDVAVNINHVLWQLNTRWRSSHCNHNKNNNHNNYYYYRNLALTNTSAQALLRTMALPAPLMARIAKFLPLPKLWNKRLAMLQSTCFVNADAAVAIALDFIDEILDEGGFLDACDAAHVPAPPTHSHWSAWKRSGSNPTGEAEESNANSSSTNNNTSRIEQRQEQQPPQRLNVAEAVVPSPRDPAHPTLLELRRLVGFLPVLAKHSHTLGPVLTKPPFFMPPNIVQQLIRVSDVASLARRMPGGGVHFEPTVAMDLMMLVSRLCSWYWRERDGSPAVEAQHYHSLPQQPRSR